MVETIINDATQELGYVVQRTGLFAGGKHFAEHAAQELGRMTEPLLGDSVRNVFNNLTPAASALKGPGLFIGIGLTAAISAGLTQMDYLHRRDNLASMYKDEVGKKLGKSADKVTASDLDVMARDNSTIKEELDRSRKQRNYGLGMSFIASMAALAVITIALPLIFPPATAIGGLIATKGLFSLAGLGGFAIKAATGILTYNLAKAPIHKLANYLFDIDKSTANDHIVAIQREHAAGKDITRKQVLGVVVAANPELSQHIIEAYGQNYDKLPPSLQDKIAAEMSSFIPLDRLTADINAGNINATGLAFAANGDLSGVVQEKHEQQPHEHKGVLTEMFKGMVKVNISGGKGASRKQHDVDASGVMAAAQAGSGRAEAVAMAGISHVQQLEQQQANAQNLDRVHS